jgi:hypothetical protein
MSHAFLEVQVELVLMYNTKSSMHHASIVHLDFEKHSRVQPQSRTS